MNHKTSVFAAKRDNLKQELSHFQIYERELQSYSDKERLRFGFSLDDLKRYIEDNTSWDRITIYNDACSIWETHMSRAGKYESYYGTSERLSVFVTTNTMLITLALGYKETHPNNPALNYWRPNRLPVITDGRLTCRLWTPTTGNDSLPLMRLAANAVAAQQPTRRYFKIVKELAQQLREQVPEYSQIPLSEFFDDELSDTILRKTKGSESDFDLGVLASSLSEYVELKIRDQAEEVDAVKAERTCYSKELECQKNKIISGAVSQWANKMRLCGTWLRFSLKWNYIIAPIIAVLTLILGYLINNNNIWWISGAVIFLALAEKLSSSKVITRALLKRFLPIAQEKFKMRIIHHLRPVEREYEEEIIKQIFDETTLLQKCIKIIK